MTAREVIADVVAEMRDRATEMLTNDYEHIFALLNDWATRLEALATPASNSSETVSKVEGGEAVAWYAQGIDRIEFVETDKEVVSRYIQNSNKALPIKASPQYHLRGPLPLYNHPAPSTLSAVELEALEVLEIGAKRVEIEFDPRDVALICAALRSRTTQPAVVVDVDDAMVERACAAYKHETARQFDAGDAPFNRREALRAALTAALTPGGGSDKGRDAYNATQTGHNLHTRAWSELSQAEREYWTNMP